MEEKGMHTTTELHIDGCHRGEGFSIAHYAASLPVKEYVTDYRDEEKFIGFCKQCRRYGTTWTCPPYDFDTTRYIEAYQQAIIIGSKIIFDAEKRAACTTAEAAIKTAKTGMTQAFKVVTRFLRMLEKTYPDSICFLGTHCLLCGTLPCTRLKGLPCRHPDKVRHSLESVGFDIGKTTDRLLGIELKWSNDGSLVEYITVVTALFTNHDIDLSPYMR